VKTIEFEGRFGDQIKTVRLYSQSRGHTSFQIIIGDDYRGHLVLQNGKWWPHLNDNCLLNESEIAILIELVAQSK